MPKSAATAAAQTFGASVLSVAMQPMVLLQLAVTMLYALLESAFNSMVLPLSIAAVAAISVYQELRTRRVLEALRELSSPRSTVVRDGVVIRIASQGLVEGVGFHGDGSEAFSVIRRRVMAARSR